MQFDELVQHIGKQNSSGDDEKKIFQEEILKRKPKVVVEVGTHKGLTSLYLAHAIKKNGVGHLYTVDPIGYDQQETFDKIPELSKLITHKRIKGTELDIDNIDFLFIDGFHEKHLVVEEINYFLPRLSKKAVVFFHDTNGSNAMCDVPGAIEEAGLEVEYLSTTHGLAKYEHKK